MPSGAVELVAAGEGVYMQNCVACHQPDGRGLPNVFPPMVGSEWVTGDPEILLRIILNGQQGPVDVAGVTYEGAMPPWATLSDEDIAAVASYIRQLDENEAGAVTPDQVATVRAATADRTTPWTAEELQALEVGPTS
jgi:mono/diheme cytochrome c family protein